MILAAITLNANASKSAKSLLRYSVWEISCQVINGQKVGFEGMYEFYTSTFSMNIRDCSNPQLTYNMKDVKFKVDSYFKDLRGNSGVRIVFDTNRGYIPAIFSFDPQGHRLYWGSNATTRTNHHRGQTMGNSVNDMVNYIRYSPVGFYTGQKEGFGKGLFWGMFKYRMINGLRTVDDEGTVFKSKYNIEFPGINTINNNFYIKEADGRYRARY